MQKTQLGTADALRKTEALVTGTDKFLILNGDTIVSAEDIKRVSCIASSSEIALGVIKVKNPERHLDKIKFVNRKRGIVI
jgi:dTDP-glucose pyrophosphorylase